MSIFTMADLHLSSDGSKSMDVFGTRWENSMEKIQKNWRAVVSPEDTVIIPGDISWALKLEDSVEDLKFLDALPGRKLIGKGNHDFWWSTASKMNTLFENAEISSISLLYNNAYVVEDIIVCGSRGWFTEEGQQKTVGDVAYEKIVNREVIRLRMSLEAAKKLQSEKELPLVAFLHFPPVFGGVECREILNLLHEYGVKTCFFGHIHGLYSVPAAFSFEEMDFRLISADFLNFSPYPVKIAKSSP